MDKIKKAQDWHTYRVFCAFVVTLGFTLLAVCVGVMYADRHILGAVC